MGKLSRTAKTYILTTILIGLGLLVWSLIQMDWQWIWLLPLAFLASLAQVFKVEGSTHESSYNISWIVYAFTFLELGLPSAVFVIVVSHLVEWARHRYLWYIQCFNIANFIIAIYLAGLFSLALQRLMNLTPFWEAAAIFLSLAVFTLVNHFLVGIVLLLARGQTFQESGVFHWMTLMMDYALLGTGAGAALIWNVNPFASPLSLLAVYLIYNTLKVPALQRKTEIDAKTGLFNAKYFAEALHKELTRANLYNRPLTLVLGDLDLLRNINNTYGHLAGDVVLVGIAKIMKDRIQELGVVARFGGEEYAILLPEATIEKAYAIVEEIRSSVEAADFEVSTSVTPIKATISFGISQRENKDQTINDLIHFADLAMYQSKSHGRNRTKIFTKENIVDRADGSLSSVPILTDETLKSRIEASQNRYRPNPTLRD